MIRKPGLFLVMLGGLTLSFSGQVDAVSPLLGSQLAVVFAATNDLAALLALNEVLGATAPRNVRAWAWAALFLGGGTALMLNTWDALRSAVLPGPFAILVGAEPVVLAWVLSHVVALVVSGKREASGSASEQPAPTAPATPEPMTGAPDRHAPDVPDTEAPASSPGSVSAPAHKEDDPDPTDELPAVESGGREALPDASETADVPVAVDLIDKAERLERQALERSGGKRGLAYREAPRRLGVRYDTARAALDAARARIRSHSSSEAGSHVAA